MSVFCFVFTREGREIMKKQNEKGNVIIEASIVMTIAVVMVAVLINLGIMLYNRNLMDTVATEAAVNVANVYSSTYRDPLYGYMDDSEFYKTELYRYVTNFVFSSQDESAERKATWFTLYSLKKRSLSEIENPKVDVEVICKPSTIIQHQIVVRIEAKYEMPLTAIWGGDNKTTYVAEGRADCIDLLDYFNTVGTVKETILSKLDKFLDHFTKLVNIFDLSSLEG